MSRFLSVAIVLVLGCVVLLSTGCTNSDKAGKKADHATPQPKPLPEAVAEVDRLRTTIHEALTSGGDDAHDKAHGPLHKIGRELTALKASIAHAGLSAVDQKSADSAADALLDAFGKIDAEFHGRGKADYEELSKEIKSAMETLIKLASDFDKNKKSESSPQ